MWEMYTCNNINLADASLTMKPVRCCCSASLYFFLYIWIKCCSLPHSSFNPPTDAFGEQGRAAKNQFSAVPPNSAVSMDVELVSVKPVVDVTGDSKVMKKTLKCGDDIRTPHDGETVHSKDSFACIWLNVLLWFNLQLTFFNFTCS